MPITYVTIKPSEMMRRVTKQAADLSDKGYIVRRPIRGLSIKKETYAKLRLVGIIPDKNGSYKNIKLPNSTFPSGTSEYSTNFIIMNHSFGLAERHQLMETFGGLYSFFFGKSPVIHSFSGYLLNTESHSWFDEWLYIYENYLSGSAAQQRNALVVLEIDNLLIGGHIITSSYSKAAESPNAVSFSFQLIEAFRTFVNSPLNGQNKMQFFINRLKELEYDLPFGMPTQPEVVAPAWISKLDKIMGGVKNFGDLALFTYTYLAKAGTNFSQMLKGMYLDDSSYGELINSLETDISSLASSIRYITRIYDFMFFNNYVLKPLERQAAALADKLATIDKGFSGIPVTQLDIIYVGKLTTNYKPGLFGDTTLGMFWLRYAFDKLQSYLSDLHSWNQLARVALAPSGQQFAKETFLTTGVKL